MEKGVVHDTMEFLRRFQSLASTWLQRYVQPKLLVCGCAIDLTANRLDVIDKIERPGECLSGVTIGQCGAKKCVGHGVERRP